MKDDGLDRFFNHRSSPGTYFNRAGEEVSLQTWVLLLEYGDPSQDLNGFEYRRVALDNVGGYEVSTVWLGLNHNFLGGAPPLIFETMVFWTGEEGDARSHADLDTQRYSTEEQARAGHEEIITLLRATVADEHDALDDAEQEVDD